MQTMELKQWVEVANGVQAILKENDIRFKRRFTEMRKSGRRTKWWICKDKPVNSKKALKQIEKKFGHLITVERFESFYGYRTKILNYAIKEKITK